MPQLLTCSSQLFFLLYFTSSPCDLQRGKKPRKTSWPMVYGHSETAVMGVTPSACALAIADGTFSLPPAVAGPAGSILGAEGCLRCGRHCPDRENGIVCPFAIFFCNTRSWRSNVFWRVCCSRTEARAHRSWEAPWEPGWGLLSLFRICQPRASLLQWSGRLFAKHQPFCEQGWRLEAEGRAVNLLKRYRALRSRAKDFSPTGPACFPLRSAGMLTLSRAKWELHRSF